MPRFEFTGDNSNKFWEIELQGTNLVIRWGKIGTQGQRQTKEFPGIGPAAQQLYALMAEKEKKGYVNVSAGSSANKSSANKPSAKAGTKVMRPGPDPRAATAERARWKKLAAARDLRKALRAHFAYLADSPGFEKPLDEIVARATGAKVKGDELVIEFGEDDAWHASLPAAAPALERYPETFRAVASRHAYLWCGKDLLLGDRGQLDFGIYDEDDAVHELFGSAANVRECLWEMFSNDTVWVFHPRGKNSGKGAAIFPIQHELEDQIVPIDLDPGSLFLHRVIERNQWSIETPPLEKPSQAAAPARAAWHTGVLWAMPAEGERLYHAEMGPLSKARAAAFLPAVANLELELHGPVSEVPLDRMPVLTTLCLRNKVTRLQTLDGIERARGLVDLDVERHELRDLAPVAKLASLEVLHASGNKIRDLAPLRACKKLSVLYLHANPITDAAPLAELRELKRIWLSDTSVRDILPLARLPALVELQVPRKLPKDNLAEFRALKPKVKVSY